MQNYEEFVKKYGKRPPDIVFAIARKDALEQGRKEGYEEATKRAIDMAVFNIPYICKFENTPGRLVGIVIPESK